MLAKMLVGNVVQRLRPDVESVHPENDGDEKQREQRKRAHGGAQGAANYHAPAATGQVANHENRHGTEGDTQPAHETEQVRSIEFFGPHGGADDGDNSEDDADDKRPPRDGLHYRRRPQIEMVRGRRGHHFSSSEFGFACGAMTGRLAPVPGSPWNFGDSDGTFWP